MENYDSSQIQILEGLKAVRKVPGMYIGSTDQRGLHHLVYEVLDNSVDEANAGYATHIALTILPDGSAMIEDDGRGIPVDIHPKYNRPGLEIVLTELHSGAKFDKKVYKITGGLHGVGVHVVNALSQRLVAVVKREGNLYYETFKQGVPEGGLKKISLSDFKNRRPDLLKDLKIKLNPDHGTIIWFWPDPEIFETTDLDYETLSHRIRDIAFLNPNITINVEDQRSDITDEFHYEGGIAEFVK